MKPCTKPNMRKLIMEPRLIWAPWDVVLTKLRPEKVSQTVYASVLQNIISDSCQYNS